MKKNGIPCEDCLIIPLCRNKETIHCELLALYLLDESEESFAEFDRLFPNCLILGVLGDEGVSVMHLDKLDTSKVEARLARLIQRKRNKK